MARDADRNLPPARRRGRNLAPVLLALVFGAASAPLFSSPASAACAAAPIRISADRGAPGSAVTVSGEGFYECNDVVACEVPDMVATTDTTAACEFPPPTPLDPVLILFQQGDRIVEVGRARGPDFSVVVTIPADAAPGRAWISATGAVSRAFTVLGPARPGPRPRTLARTGSPVATLAGAGALLVLAGALITGRTHKDRRPASPS